MHKVIVTILLLLQISNSLDIGLTKEPFNSSIFTELKQIFSNYIAKFKKSYSNLKEVEYRFEIFMKNYYNIVSHNQKGDSTYRQGLNQFTDMSFEEFEREFLMENADMQSMLSQMRQNSILRQAGNGKVVREEISKDWRETEGVVTPIKDQKRCGSCWSFSATGVLEGYFGIFENKSLSFSEQELVDCSRKYQNQGCNGGYVHAALNYVKDNGLSQESEYPYKAIDQKCQTKQNDKEKIEDYQTVENFSFDEFGAIINERPASVYYEVTMKMQSYSSGVYDGDRSCKNRMNHAMLAVGFSNTSEDAKENYILVKNSWGVNWGDQGYIKFGLLPNNEKCGILKYTYFIK